MGRSDFERRDVGGLEEDVEVRLDACKVGVSQNVGGFAEEVVGREVGNDECDVQLSECQMYVFPVAITQPVGHHGQSVSRHSVHSAIGLLGVWITVVIWPHDWQAPSSTNDHAWLVTSSIHGCHSSLRVAK
jgi:hypothetical protein